jgi:hypothetical protein
MPLLQKKPRDKKLAVQVTPGWHPNFRNFERLPDTKTVRTAFFINFGAVTVALVLLLFTVSRELSVRELALETQDRQLEIDKSDPGSKAAVALFQKYQAEEKKLRELDAFVGPRDRFVLSDFLLALGERLPRRIALTHVEYRPTAITLRGNAKGAPDEAAGDADAFIRQLRDDRDYGRFFEDVSANNQGIDTATGWFAFDLTLKFKDTASKDDKEAKK